MSATVPVLISVEAYTVIVRHASREPGCPLITDYPDGVKREITQEEINTLLRNGTPICYNPARVEIRVKGWID